ncbi:L,D-transpeptidase family protein [Maricaulis sp. D1M11]|uniref:L,D-transpeptidase family protein n=1 Tax=Maricaulis sp. D1M11 TaxID=3076117 RepID=UPI0039B59365
MKTRIDTWLVAITTLVLVGGLATPALAVHFESTLLETRLEEARSENAGNEDSGNENSEDSPPEPGLELIETEPEEIVIPRIDIPEIQAQLPVLPVWNDAQRLELVDALLDASSHGFPAQDALALSLMDDTGTLAERQDAANAAYLRLASWLRFGLMDQETRLPRRYTAGEGQVLIDNLEQALRGEAGVTAALTAMQPPVRDYDLLRAEMVRLQSVRPIWTGIDPGEALLPGMDGPRVDQLRARLSAEGLLRAHWQPGDVFDAVLDTAVRRFQGRVNLAPTGRVDRDTLRQLNMTPEDRMAQLRLNLEQRRWRSRDLGDRHIWVNLADFRLEAWSNGQLERVHQVMVGREASSTPEFSEEMQYLVINPWWGIPGGAARARFRSIRRNPGLVREYGFRLSDGQGYPISVYDIDWSRWGTRSWNYRIAQPPGPDNPLGEIKFIFPNRHNVYIHDTIERSEFIRTRRDFSAGCIRVEDPFALAEWVLNGQDGWTEESVTETAAGRNPRVVWLDQRLPVHLSYWTVVGDDEGGVRYLNDLYDRDEASMRGLVAVFDSLSRETGNENYVGQSPVTALH